MQSTRIASIVTLSLVATAGAGLSSTLLADAEPDSAMTEQAARETPFEVGETLPDFHLPSTDGETVRLSERLADGPVVMTFYRGSWCPYCRTALDSIDQKVSQINALGADVLAISPEINENGVDLREQLGLSYHLLTDDDNQLATRLGLMFTLDEKTVELYKRYGIDLPKSNGTDSWQLPIPATYVVDTDGVIRYAWTDEDYSKRAPTSAILAALQTIAEEG